jgi:hypothetical protein
MSSETASGLSLSETKILTSRHVREHGQITPATLGCYQRMMRELLKAGAPFLVGGAYALARYTGIERHTKDLDIFVRPEAAPGVLALLGRAGCNTELTFPHWLGKAYCGDDFVDIIFSSGNGVTDVDDEWFEHAIDENVLGLRVQLCPPEEMLWSKAFVMERERFDGADINHLLLHMADALDWPRLLTRFGENWQVLLAHLTLFRFAYPSDAHRVPDWVMEDLFERSRTTQSSDAVGEKLCRGTLLSREQYLIDIEKWGFRDARLRPNGPMSPKEIAQWTEAIETNP